MPKLLGQPVDSLDGEQGVLRHVVRWAADRAGAGQAPFVAVVARDGVLIGAGTNAVMEELDPTAHAEVVAVRDAIRRSGSLDLTGSVVYSNAEPCALCMLAAAFTNVAEMVFAAGRQLVPAELDSDKERTSKLIDAVAGAVPVRHADTGLSPDELRAPFTAFVELTRQ
jgi:tRNA(Arg) A34 adenosine deaminase TadA